MPSGYAGDAVCKGNLHSGVWKDGIDAVRWCGLHQVCVSGFAEAFPGVFAPLYGRRNNSVVFTT